jgi:ABC-type sugar transport system substrate-binding protein
MINKILLFSFLLLSCQQASAAQINAVLVSPSSQNDIFWSQVTKIAQASSEDLSINLQIYYDISNRVLLDELLSKLVQSKNKPDYLIFMPFGGSIEHSFDLLEQAKISFVTLERTYEQHLRFKQIARPLAKFKYWIGEVFFDNFKAGELLTQTLVKYANMHSNTKKNQLSAFGLSGDFHSGTKKRNEAFMHVAAEESIEVKQLVYTNWQKDIAKNKLLKLIDRHGMVDIIWCASDLNAVGALAGVKQLNLQPNQDVFIGGFDWTPSALQKIQNNQLTASVGGHIFQGARALIKIFDYHHGIDTFNRDSEHQGYQLEIIDLDNIEKYKKLTEDNEWNNVDFSLFSSAKQKRAITFNTLNILKSLNKN